MDTPNRWKTTFKAIHIQQALLEKAKHFLESSQFDLRIRQHLHADKIDQSIGKQKYLVLGNEQRYEPGYVVVMKGQPIVFLQGRLHYGFTLRLRLHSSLYQKQAVFVATLDTIQASLRLEDLVFYEGASLQHLPFSNRYQQLQQLFESSFVQDIRLSGLTVSLAEFAPLSKLKEMVESNQYYSIDFVPEQPNRRRLFISLQQRQEIQPLHSASTPTPTPTPTSTPTSASTSTPVTKEQRTIAIAYKIKGLPDTYELKDHSGTALGKAAVQTTELSHLLRQTIQTEGKEVKIQWNEEFGRFRIVGL